MPATPGTQTERGRVKQLEHGLDCFDALHGLGVRLIELRILLAALHWLGQNQHAARGSLGEARGPQLLRSSSSTQR